MYKVQPSPPLGERGDRVAVGEEAEPNLQSSRNHMLDHRLRVLLGNARDKLRNSTYTGAKPEQSPCRRAFRLFVRSARARDVDLGKILAAKNKTARLFGRYGDALRLFSFCRVTNN